MEESNAFSTGEEEVVFEEAAETTPLDVQEDADDTVVDAPPAVEDEAAAEEIQAEAPVVVEEPAEVADEAISDVQTHSFFGREYEVSADGGHRLKA